MEQAVIFDMDGVLIDSEPLWKKAEREVFASVGIEITEEQSKITATMTTSEVTQYWYLYKPWLNKSLEEVENGVIDLVQTLILEEGMPREGVHEILRFFYLENYKIGLSTNSPFRLISTALEKIGVKGYFEAISSSEHEHQGKPAPEVYLSTAQKLNVPAIKCVAFEDSVSGIIAAKKANMKTVAVPSAEEFCNPEFNIADLKIRKLTDFNTDHLRYLEIPQVNN